MGEPDLLCEPLQDEELHLAVSIPAPADDAEDEAKAAYAALSRDELAALKAQKAQETLSEYNAVGSRMSPPRRVAGLTPPEG